MSAASFTNDENLEFVELRSRNNKHGGNNSNRSDVVDMAHYNLPNRKVIDHQVSNEETLPSIALQYSAQVSEIKRINNIVTDQEIFGLKTLRIPVTQSFLARKLPDLDFQESSTGFRNSPFPLPSSNNYPNGSAKVFDRSNVAKPSKQSGSRHINQQSFQPYSDEVPLLSDSDGTEEAKEAIEDILGAADKNLEAVRQNLPVSSSLENGAFHFIDASPPGSDTSGIWMLLIAVIIIFVLLPLLLTILEEKNEADDIPSNN